MVRKVAGFLAASTLAAALLICPSPPALADATDGHILFHRFDESTGHSDVYVANADGSNARVLIPDAATPQWSSDATRVLFIRGKAGSGERRAMAFDLRTGTETMITTQDDGDARGFRWSPDTSKLLYVKGGPDGDFPGGANTWIMNTDGSNDHLLFDHGDIAFSPQWSPDGSQVVLTRGVEVVESLYVANADGTNEHAVDVGDVVAIDAQFAHDGERLVFVGYKGPQWYGQPGGDTAIFTINVDGSDRQQITPYVHRWLGAPTFTSDDSAIFFQSFDMNSDATDSKTGLYRVSATGMDLTQITNGRDGLPDWTDKPIPNTPPKAKGRGAVPVSLTLLVDGGLSYDPGGAIVRFEWRWGDGSTPTNGPRRHHVYAKAGWYCVRLTVTDNQGKTNTRGVWVYVS